MSQPVFRFAPSPNGYLHLGHALSALLNHDLARETGGRLLLRMEDIDTTRCKPEFEAAALDDLAWLGLAWEQPVRRQSDHLDIYRSAVLQLADRGLVYRSYLTRGDLRAAVEQAEAGGGDWPRDPDGAPLVLGDRTLLSGEEIAEREASGASYAIRLDMRAALKALGAAPSWLEDGAGPGQETGEVTLDPMLWGDVVLARKDVATSYHLSVVLDDALQAVTHVVRGQDLFAATAVHRVLQELFELPAPRYRHHELIRDDTGRKLSKSSRDTSLGALRQEGMTPADIRRRVGLSKNAEYLHPDANGQNGASGRQRDRV